MERKCIKIKGRNGDLHAIIDKPATAYRGPMIVLMHGFMANCRLEPLKSLAKRLGDKGFASLRFDFDGHGKSCGRFRDMTVLTELQDAEDVLQYVDGLDYVTGVALVGHSQGGVVAGLLAGESGEKVSALVQLAPAAVLKDDAIQGVLMGKHYDPADPPETLSVFFHKVGRNYFKVAQTLPIYEQTARYKGPVLIIHGKKDKVVPYAYSEKYRSVLDRSDLVLLEDENHILSRHRKEIIGQVVCFIAEKLKA